MKAFLFSLLTFALAGQAFASGTPVVYCKADTKDIQLKFQMTRTDEDLGVVGELHEQDSFAMLTQDTDPEYPSLYVGTKDQSLDEESNTAQIMLPESVQGGIYSVELKKDWLGRARVMNTFMAMGYASEKINGVRVTTLDIQIVASNKQNLRKGTMKGLMQLTTRLSDKVKVAYDESELPVSCTYEWE